MSINVKPIKHRLFIKPEPVPGQLGLIVLPDNADTDVFQESLAVVESSAPLNVCMWCNEVPVCDGGEIEFVCSHCGKIIRNPVSGMRVLFDRSYFPGKCVWDDAARWLVPKYDVKGWLNRDGELKATHDRVFFKLSKPMTEEGMSAGGIIIPAAERLHARNLNTVVGEVILSGSDYSDILPSGSIVFADIRLLVLMQLNVSKTKSEKWFAVRKRENKVQKFFMGDTYKTRTEGERKAVKTPAPIETWYCVTNIDDIPARLVDGEIVCNGDYILLESMEQASSSIIAVPDAYKQSDRMKVISVGPGRHVRHSDEIIPMTLKGGEVVIIPTDRDNFGMEVSLEGKAYTLAREKDMLAIVEEK